VGNSRDDLAWLGLGEVNFRDRAEGSNIDSSTGFVVSSTNIVFDDGSEVVLLERLSSPNSDWNNLILVVVLSVSTVDRLCIGG
jgi:hypothetical protein